MSVGKGASLKRFFAALLVMLSVLLLVNGLCALLMTVGFIDHHKTVYGACAAWGIASLVAARFILRGKGMPEYGQWIVPLVTFILSILVSFVLGREGLASGVWWKVAVSLVAGVTIATVGFRKKRKKHVKMGAKGSKVKRR